MSNHLKKSTALLFTLCLLLCEADEESKWGINTHIPTTSQLELCEELGVGWIRVDFNWDSIEQSSKGEFNWTELDGVVSGAQERNIHIFATLSYTPAWAGTTGLKNSPPQNSDDWYDFVYSCVTRYSYWVSHWGMWNEPNSDQFWDGSWQDYVSTILIPGYQAAKDADPDCFVLAPESSDSDRTDALEFLEFIMENASNYIDIVTHHSYGTSASDVTSFIGEQLYPDLQELSSDKTLWLTETGWQSSTYGEDFQASMYEEMCEEVDKRDYISKIFFYELADSDENTTWGIISYPDESKKEAFHTYQGYISGNTASELSSGCFIATAAFGSQSEPQLSFLRKFRDYYILNNKPGLLFLKYYYRFSPLYANLIADKPLMKKIIRIQLTPLIHLARLLTSSKP